MVYHYVADAYVIHPAHQFLQPSLQTGRMTFDIVFIGLGWHGKYFSSTGVESDTVMLHLCVKCLLNVKTQARRAQKKKKAAIKKER